jgi:hypothetical protein
VVQVYDGIFNCELLKHELSFMAQKTSKENLTKVLQWFRSNSMATTFEQTIPATVTLVE